MKKPSFSTRVGNFSMNQQNKTKVTKKILFKLRCAFGYEFFRKNQVKIPKKIFGSEYGGHCVALDKLNEKYPIMSEYINNKNSQKFIDSCKCRCCNENTYNENVELLDWATWSHTECLEHAAKKSWKKLTGKDLEL